MKYLKYSVIDAQLIKEQNFSDDNFSQIKFPALTL